MSSRLLPLAACCVTSVSFHCVCLNMVQLRSSGANPWSSVFTQRSVSAVLCSTKCEKSSTSLRSNKVLPGSYTVVATDKLHFRRSVVGEPLPQTPQIPPRRPILFSCNNVTVNMSSTGGNILFCVTWSSFGNKVNRLLLSTWEDFCGAFYWKCFNAVTTQWGMGCNWAESSRNPLLQKALVTGIVFIWSVSTIRFWSLFLNMFWQIHFFLFKFEETSLGKGSLFLLCCS